MPGREFPASKNTPAGEIAGEFREASPCGVKAAPVACHARWRLFPILEEIIYPDLDAKMANPAPTDGRPPDYCGDYSPGGRDSSSSAPEFSSIATRINAQSCGCALKFGVIAAGEADLYPRFGTTMEWDTAAGQAILEAAGGRVETFAGVPLAYDKPGFKNDGFLAWRCRLAG